MVAFPDDFNADDHPDIDFEPVPADDYKALMTASDWKDTRDGSTQYLQLKWRIVEGDYKDSNVFDNLNLKHSKPDVIRYAKSTLASVCRAVGKLRPKKSEELHNVPVIIRVTCEERQDKKGTYSNNIKKYMAASGAAPAPSKPAQQAQQPLAQEAPASAPWKKDADVSF